MRYNTPAPHPQYNQMFQTSNTIITGIVDIFTEGYFAFLKSLIIPGRLCVVGSDLRTDEVRTILKETFLADNAEHKTVTV